MINYKMPQVSWFAGKSHFLKLYLVYPNNKLKTDGYIHKVDEDLCT